jgi:hypothetical protein
MKKSINIAGIVFLVILFTGVVFKRMHFEGAGVMTTLGIFLFIAVYLPLFLFFLTKQMKSEGMPFNKFLFFIGSSGIVILTFGILAKIMHWPGAYKSLWGGIGVISFVLLLYLIIYRKGNEKISMISVLIFIILLGSFSFNMFRMGNIRPMEEAYNINGTAFSESSRIFWKECEKLMKEKVIADTTLLSFPTRNELKKLHLQVQKTDLVIGKMIEEIRIVKNSGINIQSEGEKADMIRDSLSGIILGEEGLVAMNINISAYKSLINSMNTINPEEKSTLTERLVYPFEYQDSGLLFKYLGVYNLVPEVCENTLLLWKNKIWETEYQLLNMALIK